jgi:hypothetical protein
MVHMATKSLTCRFEELKSFKSIFWFLMSSTYLNALDGSQHTCTKFVETFSQPGSYLMSTEVNLIYELSIYIQYNLMGAAPRQPS